MDPIRYVRNFLRNHGIPQYTKTRVINHFQYLFNRSENILQVLTYALSGSLAQAKNTWDTYNLMLEMRDTHNPEDLASYI